MFLGRAFQFEKGGENLVMHLFHRKRELRLSRSLARRASGTPKRLCDSDEVGASFTPRDRPRWRVEVFAQHQTAGFLQPQLLLELQGAHRRGRFGV